MGLLKKEDQKAQEIDKAIEEWRQGDLMLGQVWLTHIADGLAALTDEAASGEGLHAVVTVTEGVVLLTQTCDIVRSCIDRPFISVAPLTKVGEVRGPLAKLSMSPQYARIATKPELVADLDQVVTVEKSVVAGWKRTPGWNTDAEIRKFAETLSRKTARFAFPDDFTRHVVKRLQGRIREKYEKETDEGKALRSLSEIRVLASPAWDSKDVTVFFLFVRDDSPAAAAVKWDQHVAQWLALCEPYGSIKLVEGRATSLDGMRAREYRDSDRLDLEYLSDRSQPEEG